MSSVRFLALQKIMDRKPVEFQAPDARVSEYYGTNVFNQKAMGEYLTREAFEGTLTLYNGHDSIAMEDIALDLIIKDENI